MGETTALFIPEKKTLVIKPIMRARGMVTDPDHEAFFLFGPSTIDYCLPTDRHGNLVNPFSSKEEQEWLEKMLDVDLNIYKDKDNYWRKFKVRLSKEPRRLNLENPKHYLEYLVLKANSNFIAPDGESQMRKATYRFALVSDEFETNKKVSAAEKKKKAYIFLGKLQASRNKMVNFLKVYGNKVDPNSKIEFLTSKIDEIIEKDLDGFLRLADDADFELKLIIEEAVTAGALHKKGREYYLQGGDKLAGAKVPATIENAVAFLKNPENQEIFITLKTRVENAKD